jgi:hypothetical protein
VLLSALLCGILSAIICRAVPIVGCLAAVSAPVAAQVICAGLEFASTGKIILEAGPAFDAQLASFMICILTQLVIKRISVLHT